MAIERDYVLGTDDEEVARLGLQHDVWRQQAREAWQRAGIGPGSRVIDVGAGPGYATADLLDLVGPRGEVAAVERSERYVAALKQRAPRATVFNLDLMTDALPVSGFDVAWCRWVAMFLPSPALLLDRLARALRPGGAVVFHEYENYETWRYVPARPHLEAFVREAMASWRDTGGEANAARALVPLLPKHGFEIASLKPLVFAARPGDPFWRWPAAFLRHGAERLRELGRVDEGFVRNVIAELASAERDPDTAMVTPLVLEIIARSTGAPA